MVCNTVNMIHGVNSHLTLPCISMSRCGVAGHYAVKQPNPEAAALLINAIFAAANDPQHCQHILRGTQTGPEKHLMGNNMHAFCVTAHRLDVDDDLHQTTQLNALACLARLCRLERENKARPDWRPQGAVTAIPWSREAEGQHTLTCTQGPFGMDAIAQALVVRAPCAVAAFGLWPLVW